MWIETNSLIKSGNIVKYIENGYRYTNFPGVNDNDYCHVRPHAKVSNDTLDFPIKDNVTELTSYTKYCFWINRNYLMEILKEFI